MDKLIKILSEMHPEIDYDKNNKLIDNNVLDSFDIVTLISEINDEFDITIPVEEIVPENFNSAKALYELIERLQDN
ncbi:MAG TPA: acyl carrier protein [Clostridiales bacterium]|nr:acyl carrier protein [Clostridiales bacterium]